MRRGALRSPRLLAVLAVAVSSKQYRVHAETKQKKRIISDSTVNSELREYRDPCGVRLARVYLRNFFLGSDPISKSGDAPRHASASEQQLDAATRRFLQLLPVVNVE